MCRDNDILFFSSRAAGATSPRENEFSLSLQAGRRSKSAVPPLSREGCRSAPREVLRPGVTAAVEEAVLLVVVRGVPVRFDRRDFGERRLHCRPFVDRLEPARQMGIV